jgi:zinc D-Ala-D-Ala carboxypeptidase
VVQISAHFSLEEFLYSETAARMGRLIIPTPEQLANLELLCRVALEPIRVELGLPMVITSGLRPQWLNELIGGSKNSAHQHGLAADVRVIGLSSRAFCQWIKARDFPIDQVIDEFSQWTHIAVGYPSRRQYLNARHENGKTVYERMA